MKTHRNDIRDAIRRARIFRDTLAAYSRALAERRRNPRAPLDVSPEGWLDRERRLWRRCIHVAPPRLAASLERIAKRAGLIPADTNARVALWDSLPTF